MNNIAEERLHRFSQLKLSGGNCHSDFFIALSKHKHLNSHIQTYYDFACNTDYDHPGLSKDQYLSHPLRVAKLALDELQNPTIPVVATSLLHNLKEVSIDSFNTFRVSGPTEISQAIEILTIDRNSANDNAYLKSYYELIFSSPDFVGRVKVFDKLDNMFMLCLNKDDHIRRRYIEEIEEFVLPLARSKVPHLASYIELLAVNCMDVGFIDLADYRSH